jgi:hypothetical protein
VKTTFLVRDGLCQVVLHPETPVERAVLDLVSSDQSVEVHRTQFAETRGGFIRQFGLSGHTAVGSDYRPDLVLVLRPAEVEAPSVEPPPATADLCRVSDGTWVYRNHAGTWQPCPSPVDPADRLSTAPSDDVNTYFRRTADDAWQVYDRRSRVWHPTTGQPEVAGWTYEAEQLKGELRLARDQYCNNRGDMSAEEALEAIDRLVTNALGDRL